MEWQASYFPIILAGGLFIIILLLTILGKFLRDDVVQVTRPLSNYWPCHRYGRRRAGQASEKFLEADRRKYLAGQREMPPRKRHGFGEIRKIKGDTGTKKRDFNSTLRQTIQPYKRRDGREF